MNYIDYHIWEDIYWESMYNDHAPDTKVFRGTNPNIIFHGGCLGCKSQRIHSINRCKGCRYFKANWDSPNLFIEGEDSHTMGADEFNDVLNS